MHQVINIIIIIIGDWYYTMKEFHFFFLTKLPKFFSVNKYKSIKQHYQINLPKNANKIQIT